LKEINKVAVLGAGNGGCAAAVDLTLRGLDVRLYGRSLETLEPLRKRGGIEYEGIFGDGFVRIPTITGSMEEAMKGADVVVLMAPAHAHENIATQLAPYLADNQPLLAAPGHTLTLIPNTLRRLGHRNAVTCGTSTLPYICRKTAPDRVKVSRASAKLIFSSFPALHTEELAQRLRKVFPPIFPVPTVLDALFRYTNAIHHPPALLCNVGRLETPGSDYCHYFEGITPSVGAMIDKLDRERLGAAEAFGCKVPKLADYFFEMGYTGQGGKDGGTAYATFQNSEPNRWIKAPSTIDHRFFNEDIPFGLVPFSELGRLAGAKCEAIDAVITLASALREQPYREIGLNLQRMGFAGMDAAQVKRVVREGFAS
jgi:opine dehydrogenase